MRDYKSEFGERNTEQVEERNWKTCVRTSERGLKEKKKEREN